MKRDWLQILSNVAVIMGLVLVAVELNQSQRIAIVQSQQDWTAIFNDDANSFINSDYLPGIVIKEAEQGFDSLSPEERIRLIRSYAAQMARLDMIHLQYQEGFLSDETYEATFKNAVRENGLRWKENGAGNFQFRRSSFQEEVERILSE
jgi:hypothetical protein